MVLFTSPVGRHATVLCWMEEQQTHTGSGAPVPNHFVYPLAVWLPHTYAGFGQHRLWKRKSIIFSSLSLLPPVCVAFSCTLHTCRFMQMKNVKGRPPGCSTPGQRKIFLSSSTSHSVQRARRPTRISQSLDRHALGWLQRLLLRSLKVIYTKAANFTGAKMCNEENLKRYCAAQMIPG